MARNTRRDVLALGAASIGAHLSRDALGEPRPKTIGLQLFTLRKDLAGDLPGTLKQVAEIGYREVELFDLHGRSPKELARILGDHGLTATSGHYYVGLQNRLTAEKITGQWRRYIADAQALGLKYMVHAWGPEEARSLDDYKRLVDVLNKAGEESLKAGIRFCYHNHNFEFKKYGDTIAYDFLLAALDPRLVSFELDCFWVTRAGHDPVSYFRNYPGRFPLLHVKDLKGGQAPSTDVERRTELFTEVGRGSIPWQRIFAAAARGGMEHSYVEQDHGERRPLDSIKISYEYLRALRA